MFQEICVADTVSSPQIEARLKTEQDAIDTAKDALTSAGAAAVDAVEQVQEAARRQREFADAVRALGLNRHVRRSTGVRALVRRSAAQASWRS